jgi:hypothetical protein
MYCAFDLSKYKSFEVQLSWFEDWCEYFDFTFKCTRKMDHAGITFTFQIMCLYFHIWVRDCRHWDYNNDCWTSYDD